jgi:uncharacterized coiled-coil DUF342 family protein
MKELVSRADNVVTRVRRLKKQCQVAEEKAASLEKDIKELKEAFEAEKKKTAELNNQIKIIKLARNIGSGELFEDLKVTELKRKLNEYIREVDKCIEMLND